MGSGGREGLRTHLLDEAGQAGEHPRAQLLWAAKQGLAAVCALHQHDGLQPAAIGALRAGLIDAASGSRQCTTGDTMGYMRWLLSEVHARLVPASTATVLEPHLLQKPWPCPTKRVTPVPRGVQGTGHSDVAQASSALGVPGATGSEPARGLPPPSLRG